MIGAKNKSVTEIKMSVILTKVIAKFDWPYLRNCIPLAMTKQFLVAGYTWQNLVTFNVQNDPFIKKFIIHNVQCQNAILSWQNLMI